MKSILNNKNILLTRSGNEIGSELDEFTSSGVNLIFFPTIKVAEIFRYNTLIKEADNFDYIILTSVNAARIFISKLSEVIPPEELKTTVVSVGQKTLEFCEQNKLKVSISPKSNFSAEGIFEELKKYRLKRKKILIPCSKQAGSELAESLKSEGAVVSVEHTYDITLPDTVEIIKAKILLKNHPPDVYMFTSPSTFRNFADILSINNLRNYFDGRIVAAIGTTTKSAIENMGVNVQITPDIFTIEQMLKKTEDYFLQLQS